MNPDPRALDHGAGAPPRLYTKPEWSPPQPDAAAVIIEREVFGIFVTAGPHGLAVSHLPFLLDRSRGPRGCLTSHLALDNDHAELVAAGLPSVAIFRATHGYISSSWYPACPVRDSAPTWNFAVVHCHGRPTPLGSSTTGFHIHALVQHLEHGRENRWRMGELGPGGMERRLPRILGFDLPIDRLDVKFKMGQDERRPDTRAAIDRLADGLDPGLAELMSRCNPAAAGARDAADLPGSTDTTPTGDGLSSER